jgi:hypothetical protein
VPVHIVSRNNHLIALALTLAVVLSVALACAPVAGSAVISVGTDVGNRSPDFAMQLADGSQVTSQFLDDQDHAALLFYFATW